MCVDHKVGSKTFLKEVCIVVKCVEMMTCYELFMTRLGINKGPVSKGDIFGS